MLLAALALSASATAGEALLLDIDPTAAPPPHAVQLFRDAPRRDPELFDGLGLDRIWRLEIEDDATDLSYGRVHPGVRVIERDGQGQAAAPNDPFFDLQWGLENLGSAGGVAGADIRAIDAWTLSTGHPALVVAVVDSGIDQADPDFVDKLWVNPGETVDGTDTDGNGFVDDVWGWNFADQNGFIADIEGHGSHVAGILAAEANNGAGVAGVCWGCQIMPLRALTGPWLIGSYSWWAQAIVYAVDNGADLINLSLAGTDPDAWVLCQSIAYATGAGVPVVAAMGNNSSADPSWPARCESAIAVGATNATDRRAAAFSCPSTASFGSNYGTHLDLVAPGDDIYGLGGLPGTVDSRCGTSMATPHVTGAAALLLSVEPDLSVHEVRSYLTRGAADQVGDPIEDAPGWDPYYGAGRLDAYASLSLLSEEIADADADTFTIRDGDCDDTQPAIYPGAPDARFDGIDADCDGVGGLLLHSTPLVSGGVATVRIAGAAALQPVVLLESLVGPGPGPCPPILEGTCVDVISPTALTGITDAIGQAALSVPVSHPVGTSVSYQAIQQVDDVVRKSDVWRRLVVP